MSSETHQVKRTVRWLQAYVAAMTIAIVALFVRGGTATDGVLRVRGLIIRTRPDTSGFSSARPSPRRQTAFVRTRPGCGSSGDPGFRIWSSTWIGTGTTGTRPTGS